MNISFAIPAIGVIEVLSAVAVSTGECTRL